MKSKIILMITFLFVQFSYSQWTQIGEDINGAAAFDRLGDLRQLAISADGTIVAAGSAGNDTNGSDSGLVRVYKNVNNTWVQLGSDLNGLGSNDRFGECINLSANGQILAVGEPGEDNISLYEFINNDWQIIAKTSSINTPEGIGNAVAMNADGNYLASAISNAIYIYNYSNSVITRESVIVLDGNRNFLTTANLELNADGTVLVVGNRQYNGNNDGTEDGRVLVYEKVNNVWQLKGTPIISNNNESYFGDGIDISSDGNVIAVGSPHTEVNGKIQAGFARTYKFENGDWVQLGSDINGLTNNSNLGRSVSINDDATVFAVGSDGSRGIAQIFKLENNDWVQISSTLMGEDSGDAFGSSIALSQNGGIVAIGASDNDGNGSNSGHVRVYENLSAFPSYTNIPDANFEQYLVQNNIDSEGTIDGKILTSDISGVTQLDLSQQNIADLTGIEDFTALTTLKADKNVLTTVNISSNINLETINLNENNLSSIDVSNNTLLKNLYLNNNAIQILNLDNNSALLNIDVSNNQLTNLSVLNNSNLISLNSSDNPISAVNVSNNLVLQQLFVSRNNLTELVIDKNEALAELVCEQNSIKIIDASKNVNLTRIICNDNQLISLNLKNGNNSNIQNSDFSAFANPNLTCIEVDDVNYSNSNWGAIDMQMTFSTDCPDLVVIPDTNFEAYLEFINLGNGVVGDTFVIADLLAPVITLNVASKSISDLTGIEYFTSLTTLIIVDNNLSQIDITQNNLLETFEADFNQFTNINFSSNTKLKRVELRNNQLSTLDVSLLTDLKILELENNQLISLDFTTNTKLKVVDVKDNQILNLDFSNNPQLISIEAAYNDLRYINLKNTETPQISILNTQNNLKLTCIEVLDVSYFSQFSSTVDSQTGFYLTCPSTTAIPDTNFEAYLESINLGNGIVGDNLVSTELIEAITVLNIESKNISDLTGIEGFINLVELNANNNTISQVDVSQNKQLEILFLVNNNLTNLDVSQNLALKTIDVGENNLSFIEVSQLADLQSLSVYKNNLSTINLYSNKELLAFIANENQLKNVDIRENNKLFWIDVDDNQLEDLTIKNGNNSIITQFSATGNPNLTCIEVDDVNFSTTNWTEKDNTANYSTDCAPANDDCSKAIPLNFNQQTPGDVNSGTANNNPSCAVGNVLADVWFSVIVPQSGEFSIEGTGFGGNLKFAVYTSCQSLAPIACGDAISLTGLTVGETFYLKIWLEGSNKSQNLDNGSFTLTASESSVLSVNENLFENNDLVIYPNPASNKITIKSDMNIDAVEIYNLLGKSIYAEKNTNKSDLTLDTSNFSKGIYLVKVKVENNIILKKLIIE